MKSRNTSDTPDKIPKARRLPRLRLTRRRLTIRSRSTCFISLPIVIFSLTSKANLILSTPDRRTWLTNPA
jgi:hypothetical protein